MKIKLQHGKAPLRLQCMDEEVSERWQVPLAGQLTGVILFSRGLPAGSVYEREPNTKLVNVWISYNSYASSHVVR